MRRRSSLGAGRDGHQTDKDHRREGHGEPMTAPPERRGPANDRTAMLSVVANVCRLARTHADEGIGHEPSIERRTFEAYPPNRSVNGAIRATRGPRSVRWSAMVRH